MSDAINRTHFGDCRTTMRRLIGEGVRVQTCVTSPPYFGLRDYGHPGQLGLEATPDEYVANMVEVFRLVRELLTDDGTLWLNLGDSYAGSGKGGGGSYSNDGMTHAANTQKATRTPLANKQLIGIPWRVAFALQADGWYLRQDIIWSKPNPMPESVTDRCTKSHEYIFLLSKSARYYYDHEAIKEPAVADHAPGNKSHKGASAYESEESEHHRTKAGLVAYAQRQRSARDTFKRDQSKRSEPIIGQSAGTHRADRADDAWDTATRNKRSVWTVATQPYSDAHFATFPPKLIEPCILAGSRPGDIVLDPFMGSGTTAEVAQRLGRNWIGCELNDAYAPLQQARTTGTIGMALV